MKIQNKHERSKSSINRTTSRTSFFDNSESVTAPYQSSPYGSNKIINL